MVVVRLVVEFFMRKKKATVLLCALQPEALPTVLLVAEP